VVATRQIRLCQYKIGLLLVVEIVEAEQFTDDIGLLYLHSKITVFTNFAFVNESKIKKIVLKLN